MFTPENTVIGFIGIGVMGKSMASHLLSAGFPMIVYNRSKEKAEELLQKGAIWVSTPKEVAQQANVIFTIVGYPKDVEEVYLGKQGIITNGKSNTYVIDMTTSTPTLAVKIFEEAKSKGIHAIDAPILCKDFIIDSIQIDVAKNAGADIILLIVAALDEKRLVDLYQYATNHSLEVLMEVHSEDELKIALKTGAKLIGVNNRNLKTFEVDLSVTEKLAPIIKKSSAFLISESGIKTLDDVKRVVKAGANAILVGEMLMRAKDLSSTLQEMKLTLQKDEQI